MDAYQTALAAASTPTSEIGAGRTKAGTINAAIVDYYKSDAFTKSLAVETQRMRRAILERLRTEHGEKRIALLQANHLFKLLEPMKPHAQKNWLKTIRGLMAFAIANNMRNDDPSKSVKPIKVAKSLGHRIRTCDLQLRSWLPVAFQSLSQSFKA
jgi:site-specific recombinase XerD